MPKLAKNDRSFRMDCIGYFSPAFYLIIAVYSRSPGVALTTRFDLGPFSNHEACRGPLPVIGNHQLVGNITWLGASGTSQRRKRDTILKLKASKGKGLKQAEISHGASKMMNAKTH
ncbi:hypothetical protein D9M71_701810 [compost metagenome]